MFTTEPSLSQRIERMIADCAIVDPLAHVRGDETGPTSLDALLAPLPLAAAGLPANDRDPSLPADERLRRALPYLDAVRHTAEGWCFFRILRDLFELHENQLDASNVDAFLTRYGAATRDTGWTAQVYARANLVVANEVSLAAINPGAQWIDASRLATSDGTSTGRTSGGSDSESEQARARLFASLSDRAAYAVLDSSHLLRSGFERRNPLGQLFATLQDLDRAVVLVAHDRTDVIGPALTQLVGAYPGLRVAVVAGAAESDDPLAAAVDSLALAPTGTFFALGQGTSTFHAPTIGRVLANRLQRVPSSRFGAFTSHASTPEWIYARFQLVRKATAATLARFVADGFYEEHELPPLLRRIFHDAPAQFLDLPGTTSR